MAPHRKAAAPAPARARACAPAPAPAATTAPQLAVDVAAAQAVQSAAQPTSPEQLAAAPRLGHRLGKSAVASPIRKKAAPRAAAPRRAVDAGDRPAGGNAPPRRDPLGVKAGDPSPLSGKLPAAPPRRRTPEKPSPDRPSPAARLAAAPPPPPPAPAALKPAQRPAIKRAAAPAARRSPPRGKHEEDLLDFNKFASDDDSDDSRVFSSRFASDTSAEGQPVPRDDAKFASDADDEEEEEIRGVFNIRLGRKGGKHPVVDLRGGPFSGLLGTDT